MTTISPGANRRAAFTRAFEAFPRVLFGAVEKVGLGQAGVYDAAVERHAKSLLCRATFRERAVRYLAAQFCVRILAGRALIEREVSGAGGLLDVYQVAAVRRLETTHAEQLEGFFLQIPQALAKALGAYERSLATTIFESLAFQAGLDDFDELPFWRDVFLGLADADRTGAMGRGFADVFLDHSEEYGQVLSAVARANPPPAPGMHQDNHASG